MATVYEIPTTAAPQKLTVSLGGVTYRLALKWNAVSQLWMLDIADESGNALLSSIPVVTGADLLEPYAYLGFGGQLFAATDNDPATPPTFSNLGGAGHLYWVQP